MSQLKQDILTLLKSSGGLKTSEIAQKLQADKSDVKMVLFKDLKDICYQDTSYNHINGIIKLKIHLKIQIL